MKFEERDSEWMEAVERLIGLAESSSEISALPESRFVRTYLETEWKRLDKRQKALRRALREVPVGEWRAVGPLKAAGYRVDAVRPLKAAQRREKLRDLLWVDLDFLRQMDREIHTRAGSPRSIARRTWMAGYIRNNINLHGARPTYATAVAKWEDDLEWLMRQRVR